jgi:hypothetical protein
MHALERGAAGVGYRYYLAMQYDIPDKRTADFSAFASIDA